MPAPAPRVTVLGGGKVVNRSASSYCVGATHCRAPELKNLPELTVAVDENVMIDVPRTVAGRGWQVRALDLSSSLADGAPFIVTVSPTRS